MCNYTYLKQQIVNFADGTCRERLASLLTLQDGAFLKEVPSIAACHGLSVSLCTRCYSFGDARLVNHKQYLAGGSFLKSLGTSKWDSFHGTFIYILFQGGKRVSGSWGSEAACVVRKREVLPGMMGKGSCQSRVFRLYTKEINKFRVHFHVMFGVCIVFRDVAWHRAETAEAIAFWHTR